ncbi:DinB family protein [Sneathiella limimaris]|uniref:DinB family protein n=1 Tax=Sneathiella limimaris TaxID=1964213 RepID=UPI00146DB3BA|nr:DinB family protein [Sneathiella limimaris]
MKAHFTRFSQYNRWANQTLYAAVKELSIEEQNRELGAFFGTVINTLNHILVADLFWLERLDGQGPKPEALNQILHTELSDLEMHRAEIDERLSRYVQSLKEEELTGFLDYQTTSGIPCHDGISDILSHVFNHQTHHRGQCHHMLSQLGKSPPPLDMIYFIRSLG